MSKELPDIAALVGDLIHFAEGVEVWGEALPESGCRLGDSITDRVKRILVWLRDGDDSHPILADRVSKELRELRARVERLDEQFLSRSEEGPSIAGPRAEAQSVSAHALRLAYTLGLVERERFDWKYTETGTEGSSISVPGGPHWREPRDFVRFENVAPIQLLGILKEWLQYPHLIEKALAEKNSDEGMLLWIESLQSGALVQLAAVESGLSPQPAWERDLGLRMQMVDAGILEGLGSDFDAGAAIPEEIRRRAYVSAKSLSNVEAIELVNQLQAIYHEMRADPQGQDVEPGHTTYGEGRGSSGLGQEVFHRLLHSLDDRGGTMFEMPDASDSSAAELAPLVRNGIVREVRSGSHTAWCAGFSGLARLLAESLPGEWHSDGVQELIPDRLYQLGASTVAPGDPSKAAFPALQRDLFLARGLTWSDAGELLYGDARFKEAKKPVVLVPALAPPWDLWHGWVPQVGRLTRLAVVSPMGLKLDLSLIGRETMAIIEDWTDRQEIAQTSERERRLMEAVDKADLPAVLDVLMSDLQHWAGRLRGGVARFALDCQSGRRSLCATPVGRMAIGWFWFTWTRPAFVGETQAFEMLEFQKGADYAQAFKRRFDELAKWKQKLVEKMAGYDGPSDGPDLLAFVVELDEDRKDLEAIAYSLGDYLYGLSRQLARQPASYHEGHAEAETNARTSVSKPKKQSWTQPDLDRAIREYKAKRAARYKELAEAIKLGAKGAQKAARAMFGRNVIARALGVRSRSMVSKSEVWVEIAEELDLHLARKKARGTRRTRRTGRIGEDIALEQQGIAQAAESDPAAPMLRAEREETLRIIRQLPMKQADPVLQKYEAGEMTDDEARKVVKTLLEDK